MAKRSSARTTTDGAGNPPSTTDQTGPGVAPVGYIADRSHRRSPLAPADVRAQERAEVNGWVAVAEDLVAVPLVNVEIPAARRDRRRDVGEDPHGVHDLATAVGQQVLQHVLDRSLAHAAAQVNVSGVQPRCHTAGVDRDGQRLVARAVWDRGHAHWRAVADAGVAVLDGGEPVPPGGETAQHPGLGDPLP